MLLDKPLRAAARVGTATALHSGQLFLLTVAIVRVTLKGQVRLRHIADQSFEAGVRSLPLVMLTAVLSGVVTSQQGGYQFTGSVPLYILGSVVASSVILELGPVMTAFVVIGRVGARITAELGTMKVSEQIDALYALDRDPVAFLAAPRLIAGLITVPVLVAVANLVGLFAGLLAAHATVGLGSESFLFGARMFWHNWDLLYSVVKGLAFGFVIPIVSLHMGFKTEGGAEGVGRMTTAAVVFMIISVLTIDALFPPLFLN
jgi:phospholipid/cholesterol/gamma-HCH transport system permease protein